MKSHCLSSLVVATLALSAPFTTLAEGWGPVTVGKSGVGADCSTPSLRKAIELATDPNLGYDNEIQITDDLDARFFDGGTLTIDGKALRIVGGFRSRIGQGCVDLVRDGRSTLSGLGGSAGSVITVRGDSNVQLRHLDIVHGQASHGGGVNFMGSGSLVVSDVTFASNTATRGGGLSASGSGPISVYLESGVKFNSNQAVDGGGVFLGEGAALEWSGSDAQMWFNTASDRGGGIFVGRDATADIRVRGLFDPASQGYHASIYGNQGKKGGAIASDAFARIRVAAFDPYTPTVVAYNGAVDTGGAFHVGGATEVCINESALIGNTAARGAALYAVPYVSGGGINRTVIGNKLRMNTSQCGFQTVPWCASGVACSRIDRNQAALGAVIDFEGAMNALSIDRTSVSGNRGTHLIYMGSSHNRLEVGRTLIVGNHAVAVVKASVAFLHVRRNTIADNALLDVFDIDFRPHAHGDVVVAANLISQPGIPVLRYTGQTPYFGNVYDNLSQDASLVAWNLANLTGVPVFDHAFGSYQLHLSSAGIDATSEGPTEDMLLNRVVDLPMVPNRRPGTIGDIGALERRR